MRGMYIAVYVLAALSHGALFKTLDIRSCRPVAPGKYVIVAAIWPIFASFILADSIFDNGVAIVPNMCNK